MRTTLLFLLFPFAASGAIQNVTVTEFTATQAILKYQAPDSSPCTIEVSEQQSLRPLVNDVNPAMFSSASSDGRPGNVEAGGERFFVVGKRAAEIGLDGGRYSRALQTDTTHYFRITCPGPGNIATGSFKTMNVPFGSTYAEAEPVDRKKPGALAHPHIGLNDRTEQVIDPQTGVLLRRLSAASDSFVPIGGAPFTIARSTAWQNLSYLGAQDGQVASISASTAPLFLAVKTNMAGQVPYSEYMTAYAAAYQGRPHGAWGYYQAHLVAAVNPGGSAPANPDDAKIVACLTIDGVSCYDGADQYEVTLQNYATDVAIGTQTTGDLWQKPNQSTPSWPQESTRTGASMCDGSNRVRMAYGDYYPPHWNPGSAIQINGADYTIAGIAHTIELYLTGNCPSNYLGSGAFDQNSRIFRTATDMFTAANNGQVIYIQNGTAPQVDFSSPIDQVVDARTAIVRDQPNVTGVQTQFGYPVPHAGSNFGVLLHKKTASADTIAIDYGYLNYEMDFYSSFTVGGVKLCSDFTVPGPSGRPGYNCQSGASGNLYWVDAESGEAHLWGSVATNPNRGCGSTQQLFDANNPDKFWCGADALYSATYFGNHLEPTAYNANGGFRIFGGLPACNVSPPNTPPFTDQQPCLDLEPVTFGPGLLSLAAAFTANPAFPPQFNGGLFTFAGLRDIDENGNMVFTYSRGAGFSIGWVVVFNPAATSNVEGGTMTGAPGNFGCVGGGHPGCVVAAAPGWARQTCRWCALKESQVPFPGWVNTYTYPWSNNYPGTGPYYVQVIDGSANGTGNVLDGGASLQSCPPNAFGATGNQCTRVTVASEPLSPSHGGGETGQPGEAGPAMPGDRFQADQFEFAQLIKKDPGSVPGTWVYTLYRDINHPADSHRYANTGQNPNLYTVCNANGAPAGPGGGYGWHWNFVDDPHATNANGKTLPWDFINWNDHQFWSHGNFVVNQNLSADARCAGQNCYGTRLWANRPFADVVSQPAYTAMVSSQPKWGKGAGAADGTNIQSHVTNGGPSASPDRFPYFFDGRPYRGGASSGWGGGNVSGASYLGGHLFKFTQAQMANLELPLRKIFPTAAFSGQYPLVDVSSPAQGDSISTEESDAFKYCVAAVAGECRAGSAAGDVYANVMHLRFPFCFQAAQNLNLSDEQDLCISGSPGIRDAVVQVGMNDSDVDGKTTRILTKFTRPRVLSVFWTPNILPNGKWAMFEAQFPGDGSANKAIMLAKVPPPAGQDHIDRTTFVPIMLTIPAHAGTTAYVRFGYAENGDPGTFYCTSRSENCVAVQQSSQTADPANPFFFEQIEKQTYHPVNCNSGCQITIPGIPQRVMYYQIVYTDGNGTVTQSPALTTVVP